MKHRQILDAKRVLITADVGGYDLIRDLEEKDIDPEFRYIAFTDYEREGGGWEFYNIYDFLPGDSGLDTRDKSYYPKHCPFEIFPNAEVVVWCDANFIADKLLSKHVDTYTSEFNSPMHGRKCAYRESEFVQGNGRGSAETCVIQRKRYEEMGLPHEWGFWFAGITIRRNTDLMVEHGRLWWREHLRGGGNDQIAMAYALWKLGVSITGIPDPDWQTVWRCFGPHRPHTLHLDKPVNI